MRSSLIEAFEDANNILTMMWVFVMAIPVFFITQNIGNPNFSSADAFEKIVILFVNAVIPSFGAIIFLGLILFGISTLGDVLDDVL